MYNNNISQSVLLLLICTTGQIASRNANLCLTEDCIMASATILGSLDESVNPCDNFYQFACGGWMQKAIRAPADRFEAVDKLNQNLVLKILEGNTSPYSSPPSTANAKARSFYHSCMVNDGKYQESMRDLSAVIMYSGGWNVADELMASNDIVSFHKRMQILQNELAVNVFFRYIFVSLSIQVRYKSIINEKIGNKIPYFSVVFIVFSSGMAYLDMMDAKG